MKKLAQGFTLIELLIVISILGILAVAVLSAINPIEQINRGKDTGSQSDAEQLIGAITRYYTTNGYYPWLYAAAVGTVPQAWAKVDNALVDDQGTPQSVLSKLSGTGTGEVNLSFVTRVASAATPLYLYSAGTQGSSVYVCFKPQSNSFESIAITRCTTGLTGLTDWPPSGAATGPCPTGFAAAKTAYTCLP